MRAFVAWHRERHIEDLALIDEYFDQNEFEDELASLPGQYAPPDGQHATTTNRQVAWRCAESTGKYVR